MVTLPHHPPFSLCSLATKRQRPAASASPPGLPILGHLHLLGPLPHQELHKLSLRYGPLISLRLGSHPCVVASSPEIAKEFLKTHEISFCDRPQLRAASYLSYGSADFLFSPYNSYWRMKKIYMTQLLGGQTLEQLLPVRRQEITRLVKTLFEKSDKGEEVNMSAELVKLTNNVISRMAMSRTCSEGDSDAEEVRKIVQQATELVGKFNLADYIGLCKNLDLQGFDKRMEDVLKRFDTLLEGVLKEKEGERRKEVRTAEGRAKDLLDIMLDIADDGNAEMKLTRKNIKAFIQDVFVAGTDTSAITIEWALAELINHPTILQKARDEIDAVIGINRLVKESDIPNLPYLQAIVKETLRLHPTGPVILRESTEDCKINGYDIPARTRLFVNVWAIGRDPNHWAKPFEFKPERFIENDKRVDVRGQHFHFLPFGSGRRGCPGTSLALQVIQPMLGSMIQCFDWKVKNGHGIVDMTELPGLTLPRAQPLVCEPVARFSQMPIA
ncbi:3,9-dihydroxypterocarpan 6A-monooxygenase-like [Asparagus officinalis]|uniref:3,9-dihydroxypterocarpan 6A-monooxygenase-like n=1 Tax=Asparagus officinalis TaxID=4686 RepID=UPI00098E5420|nr:3,9-dihydroxypterocarpan 6A-monooxygenase-like [Asparagus officinalis]